MRKKGIKIEEILNLYNKGLSSIRISEVLNCTISNVSRRLKKEGLEPIRTKNKNWRRTNRYKINTQYFSKIDTKEKAYLLGILYADGSVHKDGFYLKMKDEDVLQALKKELNAEQPIKLIRRDNYESYLITISSQKLSKDLQKQGCFINKTYNLKFPDIEHKFYSHFIRGFFDGDGHLGISQNMSTCRFDLTSASVDLLKEVREIISKISITRGSLRKENGKSRAWHLRFSGRQVNQLLDWIYKDGSIFMKRKHDKFLIYKSVQVKQGELLEKPEMKLDEK